MCHFKHVKPAQHTLNVPAAAACCVSKQKLSYREKKVAPAAHLWSLYCFSCRSKLRAMARGQQKIQSQQKNAKKAQEKKKGAGADQKTAAKAALVHTCPVCRVSTVPAVAWSFFHSRL